MFNYTASYAQLGLRTHSFVIGSEVDYILSIEIAFKSGHQRIGIEFESHSYISVAKC